MGALHPLRREQVRLSHADFEAILELAMTSTVPEAHELLRRLAHRQGVSGVGAARAIERVLALGAPAPLAAPRPRLAAVDAHLAPWSRIEVRPDPGTRPFFAPEIADALSGIVDASRGESAGARTVLLTGVGGTGKSTAARWVARELGRPLCAIDLAAASDEPVRRLADGILDAAESGMVVLLTAASADGSAPSVPALLRLVTPRLRMPVAPLLIEETSPEADASTTDTDVVIRFALPAPPALEQALIALLDDPLADPLLVATIAAFQFGADYRALAEDVARAQHFAEVSSTPPLDALHALSRERFAALPPRGRRDAALSLLAHPDLQPSQRTVHALTGVSRETLRKYAPERDQR